jgi:hypothetical protein
LLAASCPVGVGHSRPVPPSSLAASVRLVPACAFEFGVFRLPLPIASDAVGVGQYPEAGSSLRGIDGASWNNKCLDGVAECVQVRKHSVETQVDEPSNIFTTDPTGSDLGYKAAHLRPEIAVIVLASLLPGNGIWLARKAAGDNVDGSDVMFNDLPRQFVDVLVARHIGPMLRQHLLTEFVLFTEGYRRHASAFKAKAETADPAEEIEEPHAALVNTSGRSW